MSENDPDIKAVLAFWFGEVEQSREIWFKKDDGFDAEIRHRFGALHGAASRGGCDAWAGTPDGTVALVVVLDQFSRNLFRGDARAFDADAKALALAKAALDAGLDKVMGPYWRQFLYLPLEHSENLADQDRCVALVEALDNADLTKWAVAHRDIIARFGRFPHRNAVLGRDSTEEEFAFLKQPGSSF